MRFLKNKEESINLKKVKLTANILFSGIGCQERGFEDSGLFDIKVLNTSDINKESVLSYAAIHCGMTNKMVEEYEDYPSREEMAQYLTDINLGYEPEKNKFFDWFKLIKRKKNDLEKYWLACKLTNNLGDISRVNELPYADFWTISFCCQDISVAGKMKGLKPDSGTRSSLLWDNINLLNKAKDNGTLPKYLMFENVKNLVSKKFIDDFNSLIDVLGELGFNTYWSVINGKDCGVPQNRERVFVIAIRNDIDSGGFTIPEPFDTGIRLKDVLEEYVDDKYYLSDTALRKFKLFDKSKGIDIKVAGSINPDKNVQDRVRVLDTEGISQGLRATDYKDPVKITVGIDKSAKNTGIIEYANCITSREDRGVSNYEGIGTAIFENEIYPIGSVNNSQDGIVVSPDGISKTHTAGHNNCPKIIETGKLKQIEQLYGTTRDPNPQAGRVYDKEYLSPTIDSCGGGNRMPKIADVAIVANNDVEGYIRVRKLTPRECYKLMGLSFEDCDKAASLGVADTHLYKQAGNGIITNCCELLAEHLYKAQYDNTYICTDEKYQENITRPQVE